MSFSGKNPAPNASNCWVSSNVHATVRLPIKTIAVDEKIAPAVKWLNDQMEVFTLWSCEGTGNMFFSYYGPKAKVCGPRAFPYILFICRDLRSLALIKARAQRTGVVLDTNFERMVGNSLTTHTLVFRDHYHIKEFCEDLQNPVSDEDVERHFPWKKGKWLSQPVLEARKQRRSQ